MIAILFAVLVVAFTFGHQPGLKFYPALVNLGFLLLFGASLLSPPSFVERIARLRDPLLPDAAVAYTTRVTWAWTIFFAVNGSIAAITALWASDEVWMLYNGLIAYLLIGLLAGGEWLLRLDDLDTRERKLHQRVVQSFLEFMDICLGNWAVPGRDLEKFLILGDS